VLPGTARCAGQETYGETDMSDQKMQGEGDRESARNFNKKSQEFLKTEEGKESMEKSDHQGQFSMDELKSAEKDAAERAYENDPEALRDYSKPAKK